MRSIRSVKQIAATVRKTLKQELPGWNFSVRSDYNGIDLHLMSGPAQVTVDGKGYAQLNHYNFLRDETPPDVGSLRSNGVLLTPLGWSVMSRATEILAAEHWDESRIEIDYFCCNYYMHVSIGRWDKNFELRGVKHD